MQSNASRQMSFVFRQQQTASRRRIVAGKFRELHFEILEAEVDAERLRVLQKELAHLCNLRGSLRLRKYKSWN